MATFFPEWQPVPPAAAFQEMTWRLVGRKLKLKRAQGPWAKVAGRLPLFGAFWGHGGIVPRGVSGFPFPYRPGWAKIPELTKKVKL